MIRYSTAVILAAALVALAMNDDAKAQNALGDGRRLDNNMQQGSGGVNNAQGQTAQDYRLRNDLVTGNVAGLGYFHGNVGYRAPGEFYGHQSSDALFRFRAQSLSPSPSVNLGQAGTVGTMAYGQPTVGVYQNQSPTPTLSSDVYTGGRTSMATAFDTGGLGVRSSLPSFSNPTGMTLAIPPEQTPSARIGGSKPVGGSALPSEGSVPSGGAAGGAGGVGTGVGSGVGGGIGGGGKVDPEQYRLSGGNAVDPGLKYLHPGLSAALGIQLQSMLQPQRADGTGLTLDQRVEQIRQALVSPVQGNQQAEPGQDVYADILRRLSPPSSPTSFPPFSPPSAQPAAQSSVNPSANASSTTAHLKPGDSAIDQSAKDKSAKPDPFQPKLADPTPEQLKKAEAERIAIARRSLGLPVEPPVSVQSHDKQMKEALTPGESESSTKDLPPALTTEERAHRAAKEKLDAIMQSLRYQGPALSTFAGQVDDMVNRSLRAAEEDLQQGRYFDAENRYRLVLQLRPGYPLARVGLVHSQIGSGLLLSAGQNLQSLLTDHPELIAVRYQANLLPSAKRLEWVRSEADRMMELSRVRHEPAILLAYLGYQFDQPMLTRYGLDLLAARRSHDPLLPVLERLWSPVTPR